MGHQASERASGGMRAGTPVAAAAITGPVGISRNVLGLTIGLVLLALNGQALMANHLSASMLPLLAITAAGVMGSVAGLGLVQAGHGLLAPLISEPVQIVRILVVCSIATQAFGVVWLWRHMNWQRLPAFLIGGLVGLPFGLFALTHLSPRGFHLVLGSLLLAYGVYLFARPPVVLRDHGRGADVGVGLVAGVIGGLAGMPGAVVATWCSMKGWDKHRQRGVTQPFILAMQLVTLTGITLLRATDASVEGASYVPPLAMLEYVLGGLFGSWCGLHIFHHISERGFRMCMACLLALSGVAMLI